MISGWLGLPPIADNICEGIVIRPVEPVYLRNGSRVLLKSKNARFAEKKAVKKRAPKLFVEPSYSAMLNKLLIVAEQYITENRLNNVVSKIGEVSLPKEMGKLIGLFSKDILDDFLKEHSGNYAAIEKSEQKILNRHVNALATNLIKRSYGII
jgi:Rnl2 family RNA ligase